MAATSGCNFRNCSVFRNGALQIARLLLLHGVLHQLLGDHLGLRVREAEARIKAKRREGFRIPGTVLCNQNSIAVRRKPSNLIPLLFCTPVELEVELRSELNNARPLLLGGDTEVRVRLRDHLGDRILRELQGQVAAARERIQRMVKEVVSLRAELQLHTFRHLEVLEHRQIRIEERRSVGRGKQGRAIADQALSARSKQLPLTN